MAEGGELNIKTENIKLTKSQTVTISAFRLEFIDTGYGIHPDKINEIFDYYYTSKKSGTGLGLAIARQIIEGHNGTISATSNENVGTKLIIEIDQSITYKMSMLKSY